MGNNDMKERLKKIVDEISRIEVPVGLADRISRPLCKNLYLLSEIIDELPEDKEETTQEEAEENG